MTNSNIFAGVGNSGFTVGGADGFLSVANGFFDPDTTEAWAQTTYRVGGTFSKLLVFVATTSATNTSTFRFRKNGADGNQNVAVASLTSGFFQDTTNSDTIASGDVVNLSVNNSTGTGSLDVATLSIAFSASGTTEIRHAYNNSQPAPAAFSTASTTFYGAYASKANTNNQGTTETRFQDYVGQAATSSKFYVNISTNARGTGTDFKSRVNGANGNLALTVAAAGTGVFEDTSNSDTLAQGDLINYSITTGTGAGNIVPITISAQLKTSNNYNFCFWGRPTTGLTIAGVLTRFLPIAGWRDVANAASGSLRCKAVLGFTASRLSVRLDSNPNTATISFAFNINTVDSALAVTIPIATAGRFTDVTNSVAVVAADDLTYKIIQTGTGTVDYRTASLTFLYAASSTLKDVISRGGVIPFAR